MADFSRLGFTTLSTITTCTIYKSRTRLYVVGTDRSRTQFRILEFDRTHPTELKVKEKQQTYSYEEAQAYIDEVAERHASIGGLQRDGKVCGIMGVVRLPRLYLVVITKKKEVAAIANTNPTRLWSKDIPMNTHATHGGDSKEDGGEPTVVSGAVDVTITGPDQPASPPSATATLAGKDGVTPPTAAPVADGSLAAPPGWHARHGSTSMPLPGVELEESANHDMAHEPLSRAVYCVMETDMIPICHDSFLNQEQARVVAEQSKGKISQFADMLGRKAKELMRSDEPAPTPTSAASPSNAATSNYPNMSERDQKSKIVEQEVRNVGLFQSLDFSRDFYFSYDYDLTNTLEFNLRRSALLQSKDPEERPSDFQYNEMYLWNLNLSKEFLRVLPGRDYWLVPVICGFCEQKSYASGHSLTLLARRSRHHAGPRLLKRGLESAGHVANEVETEQIYYHYGTGHERLNEGVSSYLSVRGSIPLYWSQPNPVDPQPEIILDMDKDPDLKTTEKHFEHLFERYGAPLMVMNLVRMSDREQQIGNVFRDAVTKTNFVYDSITGATDDENGDRPMGIPYLLYRAYDFLGCKKAKRNVNQEMSELVRSFVGKTGYYAFGFQHRATKDKDGKPLPPPRQTGAVRVNCIDCLDRTNVGQFCVAKAALHHQLLLGMEIEDFAQQYPPMVEALQAIYTDHGNRIAQQYAGSGTMHSDFIHDLDVPLENTPVKTTTSQLKSAAATVMTAVKRYYNRNFEDNDKQAAIDILLGNVIVDEFAALVPPTPSSAVIESAAKPVNTLQCKFPLAALIPATATASSNFKIYLMNQSKRSADLASGVGVDKSDSKHAASGGGASPLSIDPHSGLEVPPSLLSPSGGSAAPLSPTGTSTPPDSPSAASAGLESPTGAAALHTIQLATATDFKAAAAAAGVSPALLTEAKRGPHHNARGSIVTFDDFMTEEEKRARNTTVIDSLVKQTPGILFSVGRSKNENIVVYEIVSGDHVGFTPQAGQGVTSPVDAYWMRIDPAYVGKNKKLRQPLSMIEKSFLFGLESVLIPDSEKATLFPPHKDYKDAEYGLELHLLPGRYLFLARHKKRNCHRALMRIRGNLCELVQIFVSQQERTLQLPKIKYIELVGRDVKTGAVAVERIAPDRDQSELLGPLVRQQLAQRVKKATSTPVPAAETLVAQATVRPYSLAIFR